MHRDFAAAARAVVLRVGLEPAEDALLIFAGFLANRFAVLARERDFFLRQAAFFSFRFGRHMGGEAGGPCSGAGASDR